MNNLSLFALALIASVATITPVVAAEAQTVSSIVITADLDLSSDTGQRTLDRRIARAATEVCGVASDADVVGKNDIRQCRAETIASVAAQREQLFAAASRGAPIVVALRY